MVHSERPFREFLAAWPSAICHVGIVLTGLAIVAVGAGLVALMKPRSETPQQESTRQESTREETPQEGPVELVRAWPKRAWTVEMDPPSEPIQLPDDPINISLKDFGELAPLRRAGYFVLFSNGDTHTVLDLRAGMPVGQFSLSDTLEPIKLTALSSDGSYVAVDSDSFTATA